jgi:2,5-diamino-6-(ribosylamino)-4(3H)-pyrimidinone 5'-phosphate reductase
MSATPARARRSGRKVTIAGHYAEIVFPPPPPDRPYVYINMVSSVDGKATVDGSERGLGSADDKRMMQELRSHADAVMNGAATLRISGSSPVVRDAGLLALRRERGLAPQPLGVIVSRRGELPLDAPFFTSRDFEGLVVVTEAASRAQVEAIRATGRRVAVAPDGPDNGAEIVRLLWREFGVRRLLCEGGPTLNQTLFRANVVDEFFLTFAPWIVGGAETITTVEGVAFHRDELRRLRLLQLLHDRASDEVFLRYGLHVG